MDQLVLYWGGICAAALSIIALMGKAIKVFTDKVKKKRKSEEDFKNRVLSSLDTIIKDVENLSGDIGDLQCDRLNQAHDYYMEKGYCATEKKTLLCGMYASYHGKGRNHLSEHYEKDIMSLPDKPKGA